MRAWPPAKQFLLALLLLYLGKETLTVVVFPAFTGHDEVAHFAYVELVAEEYRVPKIPDLEEWQAAYDRSSNTRPPGDYVPTKLYRYCRYFTADWLCGQGSPPRAVTWRAGGDLFPTGWIYTANHPPLYYLLMTPVYLVTDGASAAAQQFAMRAASIIFGMLTVLCAYLLATTLFPGDSFLGITVPAFVAFQPQVSYEAAMLNNDILAIALYSLILYLLVRGLRDRFPWQLCAVTGFAFGLALLAKGTAITAIPIIALAVILGVGWRNAREWAAKGAVIAGVGGALASPWYLYLYRTYGNLDGFEQISDLQVWSYFNQDPPGLLDQLWNRDFAALRWKETWGEFGWRLIHLGDGLLWAIGIACLIALAGFGWYLLGAVRRRPRILAFQGFKGYLISNKESCPVPADPVSRPRRWQMQAIVVLLATAVLAYLAVLEFGTRFALTQARYYFPAVNAVALVLMLGLRTLIPAGIRHYGQTGIVVALLAMNVVIYTQYVIPYWHLDMVRFDVGSLYGGR